MERRVLLAPAHIVMEKQWAESGVNTLTSLLFPHWEVCLDLSLLDTCLASAYPVPYAPVHHMI